MPRIPFIGSAYTLRTIRADCQNCINYFPEIIESGAGANNEGGVLLQVPGLRRLATIGTGPIRGVYFTSSGHLAVVSGAKLYAVSAAWVATEVGTLRSTYGRVEMADNGVQIILVDGDFGYISSMVTGGLVQINQSDLPACNRVTFQDGYFIVESKNTNQFAISALYDGMSWNALDFGVAEGLPDNVVAVVSNQRQLWVAGSKSMEVYWNSGDEFPFSRIDGSFQEFGCAAPHSMQKVAGSVMWLTDSLHVVFADGYKPVRVSNHAVELAIRAAGDVSGATAYSYKQDGHIFYCLKLPGANSTWVYDFFTKNWHERAEWIAGAWAKSRVDCCCDAYGEIVVGDSTDGRIYAYDFEMCSNDGDVLARERTASHVANDLKRMIVQKFQLDIDGGHGLITGQGSIPQVMLQCSKDGGYTFGNEHWQPIGAIGNYRARAIFRQLGQARDWVFRIRVTDPVKANLLGADIDAIPGVN